MESRWFAMYDRAVNLTPVWTSLLCALTYREMVLNNMDVVPEWSRPSKVPPRTKLDGGILRLSLGLLADPAVKRMVSNYVFCLASFRGRAGLRTANRVPPSHANVVSTPFHLGTFPSVANRASSAAGEFMSEVAETCRTVLEGKVRIDPSSVCAFTSRWDARGSEGDEETVRAQLASAEAKTPLASVSLFNDLQPGLLLGMHIGARIRSCAVHTFGVQAFGGLLHHDPKVAIHRYLVLKDRANIVHKLMSADLRKKDYNLRAWRVSRDCAVTMCTWSSVSLSGPLKASVVAVPFSKRCLRGVPNAHRRMKTPKIRRVPTQREAKTKRTWATNLTTPLPMIVPHLPPFTTTQTSTSHAPATAERLVT